MPAKITGDSVRAYLRDIGRIPLLEHDEEILLGRKVQRLMELQKIKEETGCTTKEDLAVVLDISIKQLRKELKDGEKAKDKMVTANLRLVVSVAKKYTKRNMELPCRPPSASTPRAPTRVNPPAHGCRGWRAATRSWRTAPRGWPMPT